MSFSYNIFGSVSSIDYDVMVYLDAIPSIQESKELCAKYEAELASELPGKKINVNLAVLEDGIIAKVFKGTADECNNSIYHTWCLHDQPHGLPINRVVFRNVELKLARGIRVVLSFLSRTEHREKVKQALKGSTALKLSVLEEINFEEITDLGKNNQDVTEFYKQAAFQIGQCMCLMQCIDREPESHPLGRIAIRNEVYTKEAVARELPDLAPYLLRLPCNGYQLDVYKSGLIQWIRRDYPDLEVIKEDR